MYQVTSTELKSSISIETKGIKFNFLFYIFDNFSFLFYEAHSCYLVDYPQREKFFELVRTNILKVWLEDACRSQHPQCKCSRLLFRMPVKSNYLHNNVMIVFAVFYLLLS